MLDIVRVAAVTPLAQPPIVLQRKLLAHRVPFVLGMPVYESFQLLSGRNAVYTDLSGTSLGGHAVVVVGFDDDRFGGAFRVLNSWGPGWGDRGFFWLPYDTFREARFDAFALTIEDRVNGDVAPRDPPSRTSACGAGEALPNLTVASWEVEYRATAGGAGRWMWRVTNTGTATAPAGVDVNLLLSRDRNINASDHWVIYEEIPFELAPGRAAFRDVDNARDFTIPETIPPGLYYMAMWVDDVAEVRECDETDNLLIGRDLVELQSGKPDLVPTSWFAEWDSDGNGELEYRVENGGTSATTHTGWWIALVLHTEAELFRGHVYRLYLDEVEFLLDPGEAVYRDAENAARFHLTDTPRDGTVPAGVYYMSLWVDHFDEIDESNERNNVSSGTGFVRIGLPPLPRLGATRASPGEAQPSVPAASFNGLVPPNALTRKVRIIADEDGKRRVQFLDELPRSHVPPYNSHAGAAREAVPPQPLRHLGSSSSAPVVFDKRNVSADVGNTPIVDARPMPE